MRRHRLVLVVLVTLLGCDSRPYKVAQQVSGRVTLDGKPLPKASVTFVPMASKDNQAPGPTAYGETDADGRYKLIVNPETPGAVVGKCRVFITTLMTDQVDDDRDAGRKVKLVRDKVPEKYNKNTELVFDVPASGTDQANFDLKSR